jgi:two-component system chemotaxis sensor kinase CheA
LDLSRYRGLFFDEAFAHVGAALDLTPRLADPDSDQVVREVFRHAHSLKGLAATMGFRSMNALAHAAEDLLAAIRSGEAPPGTQATGPLLDAFASIERMLEAAHRGEAPEDAGADALLPRLRSAAAEGEPASEPSGPTERHRPPDDDSAREDREKLWRVDLAVRNQGVVSLEGVSRLFRTLSSMGTLRHTSLPTATPDGGETVGRVRVLLSTSRDAQAIETLLGGLPEVRAFTVRPEPALSPSPTEASTDPTWIRVRADLLDRALEDALELVLEVQRLSAVSSPGEGGPRFERGRLLLRDLYAKLLELRLVPFASIAHRITRAVHDLKRELGKQARLEIEGRDVRLDRSILEAVVDPLHHLARNALDHGIESPAERRELGKPAEGRLRIRLRRRRDRIDIIVEDDGRGIDPDQLRSAAVRQGLLSDRDAACLHEDEARMLATLPGLSTRLEADSVSGRGVGMDTARAQVEALGGKLRVASDPGRGTRIELSLPVSKAIVPALLFRSCGELYAVALERVERTVELDRNSADRIGRELPDPRCDVPLTRIENVLDGIRTDPSGGAAVVVSTVRGAWGIVADELVGRRELFVRPLDAALRRLPGFEGSALLDDGSVVLVIDPDGLDSARRR